MNYRVIAQVVLSQIRQRENAARSVETGSRDTVYEWLLSSLHGNNSDFQTLSLQKELLTYFKVNSGLGDADAMLRVAEEKRRSLLEPVMKLKLVF